ncbi:complex I NDUFA9 subunit family protein [Halobacteriales archaeon QS_4_62_28]|nr:MAG: complex I NDUFA9 subunit family protein [Halobacteriales archaeon QS_4_62_28]
MDVLVVGGSGFIGTHLCEELTDRGHDVTALSRSPGDADIPDGVRTVTGDVTDYESIEGVFDGQDAAINLVALSPLFKPKGGDEMHDRIHRGGTENCVQAAEEHGVERFVQMSALGADPDGPTHYIRSKGRAEEAVRDSSLDWVIIRPSVVFGEGGEFVPFTKKLKGMFAPGLPIYPLPGGGRKTRFEPIWVGDLVPMLADALTEDEHGHETYEIGGPEVLTLREVTEAVYEAEDTSVSILPLPMALAGVGLKTLDVVPGFPMGADQYRSLNFDNTTRENESTAFGVETGEMTSLHEYLGR